MLCGLRIVAQAKMATRSTSTLRWIWRPMSATSKSATHAATNTTPLDIRHPSLARMKVFALSNAVPMIGFGCMDNFVMIQAGDLIDTTIGVTLGLATLTAAGIGQIFSDVSGVAFGGVVERVASRLGLAKPDLTKMELELPLVRRVGLLSRICGVVIGCLIGMTSLLFMDLEKSTREKKARELSTIFKTVVAQGRKLVMAEQCKLFLIDEADPKYMYTKAEKRKSPNQAMLHEAFDTCDLNGNGKISEKELIFALQSLGYDLPQRFVPELLLETFPNCVSVAELELGFEDFENFMVKIVPNSEIRLTMGNLCNYVYTTGKMLNIPDVYKDERFNHNIDLYAGAKTKSILIGPVFNSCGDIVGFVQVKNKNGGEAFNKQDEIVLDMLCSHVSVFLQSMGS
eukprot:CFRG6387T1